jgi:SAM-dependent methyltransferase
MNKQGSDSTSWNQYWQGTGSIGAFTAGGVNHPAITEFWNEFFLSVKRLQKPLRLLDVATGNGAVVEAALRVLTENPPTISCVDISDAAIENVKKRFESVTGIVADAANMPLDDRQFDVVCSQFGVEYAGTDAIYEAARLVEVGGKLALLMHIAAGSVLKECADSLAAVQGTIDCDFLPLAIDLFENGFAAVQGADRAAYDAAGSKFAPAVAVVEQIMDEFGDDVAGGTIAKLYDDIARIHARMPNYEAKDILDWLGVMEQEFPAYAQRMASMIATASDQASIDVICKQLRDGGFDIDRAGSLQPDNESLPLAWVIIATRSE